MHNTKRSTSATASRKPLRSEGRHTDGSLRGDRKYLRGLSEDSDAKISGLAKTYLFKERTAGSRGENNRVKAISRPGTASTSVGRPRVQRTKSRLFDQTLSSISKVHSPRTSYNNGVIRSGMKGHGTLSRPSPSKRRAGRRSVSPHELGAQEKRIEEQPRSKADIPVDMVVSELLGDLWSTTDLRSGLERTPPSQGRNVRASSASAFYGSRYDEYISVSTPMTSYSDPTPFRESKLSQFYRFLNQLNSLHFQTMELQSDVKELMQDNISSAVDDYLSLTEQKEYRRLVEEFAPHESSVYEFWNKGLEHFPKTPNLDPSSGATSTDGDNHVEEAESAVTPSVSPVKQVSNFDERGPNLTANALESRYGPPPTASLNRTMVSDATTLSENLKQMLFQSKDDMAVKYRMEKIMRKLEKERIARMKLEKKFEALVASLPSLTKVQTPKIQTEQITFDQNETEKLENRKHVPPRIEIPDADRITVNKLRTRVTPKLQSSVTTPSSRPILEPIANGKLGTNRSQHSENGSKGKVLSTRSSKQKGKANSTLPPPSRKKEQSQDQQLESKKRKLFSRARHNRTQDVENLLSEGLSPDVRDAHGNTILMVAAQNGHRDIMEVAINHGANLNATNNNKQTALHFCYRYGYTELGEYLLSKGADDTIRNKKGLTCYEGL